MTRKILFVVTNHTELGKTGKKTGYFLSEITHPYYVLKERGFQIDFASPQGGKAEFDPSSYDLEDSLNAAFVNDSLLFSKLEHTLNPKDLNEEDYSAIFYAGGHGTMWDFSESEALHKLAAGIYQAGGVIGAVCHGPSGLLNIRLHDGSLLIAGKELTSFTNEEEDAVGLTAEMPFALESELIKRGATFTKADNFQANTIVSERLVTGQNPASASTVGKEMAQLLAP